MYLEEFLKKFENKRIKLYVDMDGVLDEIEKTSTDIVLLKDTVLVD